MKQTLLMSNSDGPTADTASLYTAALIYVHDSIRICALSFSCELCDVGFVNLHSSLDWGPDKERCDSADKLIRDW